MCLAAPNGKPGGDAPQPGQTGDEPADAVPLGPIQEKLIAASKSGDEHALVAGLNELWQADAAAAGRACEQMLRKGTFVQRLLATASIARHAEPAQIASVVRSLESGRYRDERRWLVRAIGRGKDKEEVVKLAEPFLQDNDQYVRIAAYSALGDAGLKEGIRTFVDSIATMPQPETRRNVEFAKALTQHGVVRSISGIGFKDANEVRRWWRSGGELAAPDQPRGLGRASEKLGRKPDPQGKFATQRFSADFEVRNWQQSVKMSGVESWNEFGGDIDEAARRGIRAASMVFGPVHLPVIDLVFADNSTIASYGGTSEGYSGFAQGSRIAIRLDVKQHEDWEYVLSVIAHEMVHIAHAGQFDSQPRWLAEGIAESLVRSREDSVLLEGLLVFRGSRLIEVVERGAITEAVQWTGFSNTMNDGHLYGLSWLVVDYLRFGGFAEPEIRLAALMGRFSRSMGPDQALKEVYGRSKKELDEGLRKWITGAAREADRNQEQAPEGDDARASKPHKRK